MAVVGEGEGQLSLCLVAGFGYGDADDGAFDSSSPLYSALRGGGGRGHGVVMRETKMMVVRLDDSSLLPPWRGRGLVAVDPGGGGGWWFGWGRCGWSRASGRRLVGEGWGGAARRRRRGQGERRRRMVGGSLLFLLLLRSAGWGAGGFRMGE